MKCEDKGRWSEPMRRCKSRLAGACPVPVPPSGVIITCEDHFPGGICKVQCKDSFHDVVEEVGCYYGYTRHETSVFSRFFSRSKLIALNFVVRAIPLKFVFPASRYWTSAQVFRVAEGF